MKHANILFLKKFIEDWKSKAVIASTLL